MKNYMNYSLRNMGLLSLINLVYYNRQVLFAWVYNYLLSFGKTKALLLSDKKGIAHYSFYTSFCYKFSFMGKEDYVIGPCWTRNDLRGGGIYPVTINYLASMIVNNNNSSNVYILVRPENKESIKGVEKFKEWVYFGTIKKTIFKNYKNIDMN